MGTIVPLRAVLEELPIPQPTAGPVDPGRVFTALAVALVHRGADPEAVRLRLLRDRILGDPMATPEQRAGAVLDALPNPPELYWHGRDGLPCPCSTCTTNALRMMARLLDEAAAEEAADKQRQGPRRRRRVVRSTK